MTKPMHPVMQQIVNATLLPTLTSAPLTVVEDAELRTVVRDLEMHGHDDSEQVKGAAPVAHRWPPESVAYHLSEAIREVRSFKSDRSYLLRLLNLMDEVEAQAEDVGSEVYVAMCSITKWCQAQIDECEYRRVNGED